MTSLVRRIATLLLIAFLAAALVPAPVAAGQGPNKAEARLHSLISNARKDLGRVPLRWDRRLADVAQYRSDDMAENNYFAHPSSTEMAKLLENEGIVWYRWGETIAWNKESTALASADRTFKQWRNSETHWKLLTDVDFNYMAIGVARGSDGRYIWTAIMLKGPDRTKPKAWMVDAKKGSASDGKRTVTVSWAGRDVKLSVLTSGLCAFRLQRKVGKNAWKMATDWTTATSRKFKLTVGKTYKFRVRARDCAGNKSTWSVAITVKP